MAEEIAPRPVPYIIRDGLAVFRLGEGVPLLFEPYPHGLGVVGDARFTMLVEGLVGCGREVITFDPAGARRDLELEPPGLLALRAARAAPSCLAQAGV